MAVGRTVPYLFPLEKKCDLRVRVEIRISVALLCDKWEMKIGVLHWPLPALVGRAARKFGAFEGGRSDFQRK